MCDALLESAMAHVGERPHHAKRRSFSVAMARQIAHASFARQRAFFEVPSSCYDTMTSTGGIKVTMTPSHRGDFIRFPYREVAIETVNQT